jgi:hypothetical protein
MVSVISSPVHARKILVACDAQTSTAQAIRMELAISDQISECYTNQNGLVLA